MNNNIVLGRRDCLSATILIAVVLLAMALVPAAEVSAQEEDMEAVVNAIWTEYCDSLIAGDVDRWVQLWTEDGVQMPPGEPPVEGKANILERNKAAFAPFDVDMSITNLEYQVAGNWAFSRGIYTATLTPKAGGDFIPVDGKYMTILQKQPDGTWKVHRDIFNSNVP